MYEDTNRSPHTTPPAMQVLGLGMLLAASWVAPAIAETLAKPSETGGERVKAPKSAPTASATTTKPQPTSNPVDGQGLVGTPHLYPSLGSGGCGGCEGREGVPADVSKRGKRRAQDKTLCDPGRW